MASKRAPREEVEKPAVPLSEDQSKITTACKKEVIKELKRIAEAHPDQVITRNFFRVHSQYAESAWNGHFGTFQEFKRQAGIILSRHAHRLEKNLAKHASTDSYRKIAVDRMNYAEKYRRPNKLRFRSIVVGTDVHDKECDPFWRRCFIDTIQRVQPERVFLNGDIFDLPEFSKYTVDPREWDVVGRIEWVHTFLADIRAAAPNTDIDLLEGNHEYRLMRHLAESTPALRAILADLHGFTVPKLLGLDNYEVNYIARCDLHSFNERDIRKELSKNYAVIWDAVLGHHFPEGRNLGMPGWNGHHHRHLVHTAHSPVYGTFEWHQIGAGHERAATYTAGEAWSNGILIGHVDTHSKATAFEYIDVRDFAVIGGQYYVRRATEAIHA